MDRNRVIGQDGGLPWRLPADLAHFKRQTSGHHIIMGRKTWESIGRRLPNRTMVVVSRRVGYEASGCVVVDSLRAGLDAARRAGETEAFVVGGASLYREALRLADCVHLTEVDAEVEGDVHFPEIGPGWAEVSRQPHPQDERHPFPFSFVVLERL